MIYGFMKDMCCADSDHGLTRLRPSAFGGRRHTGSFTHARAFFISSATSPPRTGRAADRWRRAHARSPHGTMPAAPHHASHTRTVAHPRTLPALSLCMCSSSRPQTQPPNDPSHRCVRGRMYDISHSKCHRAPVRTHVSRFSTPAAAVFTRPQGTRHSRPAPRAAPRLAGAA